MPAIAVVAEAAPAFAGVAAGLVAGAVPVGLEEDGVMTGLPEVFLAGAGVVFGAGLVGAGGFVFWAKRNTGNKRSGTASLKMRDMGTKKSLNDKIGWIDIWITNQMYPEGEQIRRPFSGASLLQKPREECRKVDRDRPDNQANYCGWRQRWDEA